MQIAFPIALFSVEVWIRQTGFFKVIFKPAKLRLETDFVSYKARKEGFGESPSQSHINVMIGVLNVMFLIVGNRTGSWVQTLHVTIHIIIHFNTFGKFRKSICFPSIYRQIVRQVAIFIFRLATSLGELQLYYCLSPGGNTRQDTNCTATCSLSRKLFKLDEPDMQDTAGEAGTNS